MAQMTFSGKLIIDMTLTLRSGLHVGGSSDYAPIGAVDSIFIRDPFTRQPIIPGSSLKGKLRTLLAKAKSKTGILPDFKNDVPVVARLFGTTGDDNAVQPSRLIFADAFPTEKSIQEFQNLESGTYLGEVKFENYINRGSGVATPRQIERVPAGMKFAVRIIYNVENEAEKAEDMRTLAEGLRLLALDYLGGHGSRGYGRVAFSDFRVRFFDAKTGEVTENAVLAEDFGKGEAL